MIYPYLTLKDATEIVHSELKEDGKVMVYVETPDAEKGFLHATYWLPSLVWEDVYGYSEAQIEYFTKLIHDNVRSIMAAAADKNLL